MNFKKKRSVRDLLQAALVILFCFAIPLWMFVIAAILNRFVIWMCLFGYMFGCWVFLEVDNG